MSELIAVTGLVATTPRHLVTQDGLPITSFRLASSQRRFDRAQNKWVEGETNWYTISSFRQLAINSSTSVSKGDRVAVIGKLHVRDWDNGERAGTSVEVEADAIGHDLNWGSSSFTRTVLVREVDEPVAPVAESDADALADTADERELVGAGKRK
ncbi:MAG: single-stranded DNA-binding protein [Actinomycetales bacterium]|nr:single-stranded DNA-binding protein [Actinomycetales bacterium]